MQQLKILFITSSLGVGGAERHIQSLCRYLGAGGHKAYVCTLSPSEQGLESQFLEDGIPILRLPLGSLAHLFYPRILGGLRRIMQSVKPDIVHSHLYHAEIVAGVASIFYPAVLVSTRHSSGLEYRHYRSFIARIASRRFSACIAVSSDAAKEAVSSGMRREIITVIPNGVDTSRFRPLDSHERERRRSELFVKLYPAGMSQDCLLVGTIAGLKPVKNLQLFLRVASRLVRNLVARNLEQRLRFVIFGEGKERPFLSELARELELEEFMSMPGYVPNVEEVLPLLDVFMLTSLKEGVPISLLEAMACGVTCIASAVGGIPEVLDGAGLLVEGIDEDSFASALQRLVEDERFRAELGRLARVRVLERYSADIWGDRILKVYLDTLSN